MSLKTLEEDIQVKAFRNGSVRGLINIIYTNNVLQNHFQVLMKPFNLTSQQYNILRILKGQHPKALSIGNIKERVLDKNSDISRIIERLRKKDLVAREPNPGDRRLMDVVLTDKGLSLLNKANEVVFDFEDSFLKNCSEEELLVLNNVLNKIRRLY